MNSGWARWAIGVIGGALAVCLATVPVGAHPTSTVEVALFLRPGSPIEVTLTSDADPLVMKLEALAGQPSGGRPATIEARESRVRSLSATLIDHLDVRVDGSRATLQLMTMTETADGRTQLIFRTSTAPGSGSVTWSTSLVFGSYPLMVHDASGAPAPAEWLQGPQQSSPYSLAGTEPSSRAWAGWRGFALGFTHILPNGIDHILFVLGLFLLNPRARSVLVQVSAFTLAHSITLGLTLYGVVSLPGRVVEPLIALSIAYVAIENIFTATVRPWRVALVFGFGLLHGMGFAEALSRLHLARSEFLSTLLSFNVGVECGQLSVIAAAAILVGAVRLSPARYRLWIVRPASGAIAITGLIWMVTRLMA